MREELLKELAEDTLKNGPHRFIRPDDKIFYVDGFKDGYRLGLKAKINMTTISDAPALPEDEDDYKVSIAKEAWDAVNTCTPSHPESFVQGYIAGAGAKRDQIKILGDRCNQLLKDKGDLIDKVENLEAEVIRLRNLGIDNINKYERFSETDRETIADLREQIAILKESIDIKAEEIKYKIGVIEKRNKRITDLEQKLEQTENALQDYSFNYPTITELSTELTKAKEIIKYLLSFIQKENYKTRWDINIADAEQFLSEVKK